MNKDFIIMAGPCSLDDENGQVANDVCESILRTLEKYKNIDYIFKSSWIKANRTKDSSFEGLNFNKAMAIFNKIKNDFKVRIITDIHESAETNDLDEFVDLYQIPAYLCRQTKLIKAAASSKPTSIKKGQFSSAMDMKYALEKAKSTGQTEVYLCERGTFFGYDNLVLDFLNVPEMQKFDAPVIVDITHALQRKLPTGISGGTRKYIRHLARAAISFKTDGLFLEVHSDVSNAKSDAATQLELQNFEPLINECMELREVIKKY